MAEAYSARRVAGLVMLTFTSGMVDAVGFIALGHVFCALATGNVLFLGLAVAGEPQLAVGNTVTALGTFVAGLALGHLVIVRLEARGRDWYRATMGGEAVVLAAAAGVSWGLVAEPPGDLTGRHYVVVALLALAMGARTSATHRLAVPGMSTVLITTSLAMLFGRSDERHRRRHVAAVVSIGAGAAAGALLLKVGVTVPLSVAAGCAAVVCVTAGPGAPGRGTPASARRRR